MDHFTNGARYSCRRWPLPESFTDEKYLCCEHAFIHRTNPSINPARIMELSSSLIAHGGDNCNGLTVFLSQTVLILCALKTSMSSQDKTPKTCSIAFSNFLSAAEYSVAFLSIWRKKLLQKTTRLKFCLVDHIRLAKKYPIADRLRQ